MADTFAPKVFLSPTGVKEQLHQTALHLDPRERLCSGCGCVVPPGQQGAEPLHLTQVDEKGAVGAVHSVEGVARV